MIGCTFLQHKTKKAPFTLESQSGKLAVITGGNSGIGFETAKSLAKQGCEVIVLCRNVTKSGPVVTEINEICAEAKSAGSCKLFTLDLADLESVKSCTVELKSYIGSRKIDYFICNGGIMMQPYSKSPQGYEIHYATNHLGHFGLVGGMLNELKTSHSKVIIITGDIAVLADDASPDFEYNDSGLIAYCRSKICNQAFMLELSARYPDLLVYVVHPGVINSHLVAPMAGVLGSIEAVVRPMFMVDCEVGAQSTLVCATTDDVPSGSYYHNVFGVTAPHRRAQDKEWSQNMWETSIKLCASHGVELFY